MSFAKFGTGPGFRNHPIPTEADHPCQRLANDNKALFEVIPPPATSDSTTTVTPLYILKITVVPPHLPLTTCYHSLRQKTVVLPRSFHRYHRRLPRHHIPFLDSGLVTLAHLPRTTLAITPSKHSYTSTYDLTPPLLPLFNVNCVLRSLYSTSATPPPSKARAARHTPTQAWKTRIASHHRTPPLHHLLEAATSQCCLQPLLMRS